MMRFFTVVALFSLVGGGCSESLKPEDLKCQKNEECQLGRLCDPEGRCVEGEHVRVEGAVLAHALVGEAYSFPLQATGGIPPYSWGLETGGQPELDWLEIDVANGTLRSQAGRYPGQYARDLEVVVKVRDRSNGGSGEESRQPFDIFIDECRGAQSCYEAQGGACREGQLECVENKLAEECTISGNSSSVEHCGADCGACPAGRANRCEGGLCKCGSVAPCAEGWTCCENVCADLENDTARCGGCVNSDCGAKVANAVGVKCVGGKCDYDACQIEPQRWLDCDGNRENGCEQVVDNEHCGGCGEDCTRFPQVAVGSCNTAVPECVIVACEQGWLDCTNGAGCETSGVTESNCGGCGVACFGDTPRCLNIDGQLRCGCGSDGQCDTNELCCGNVCVPRNEYHCADCQTGCSIATGGLHCDDNTGQWGCECAGDADCKGVYEFSRAWCNFYDQDPNYLHCQCSSQGNNCAGTVTDICCEVSGNKICTSLLGDKNNCGVCGRICKGANGCTDGVCACTQAADCQNLGAGQEAWQCVSNQCVCGAYDISPCPAGQYCCNAKGCCTKDCANANLMNDCSIGCFNKDPENIWCYWGCCEKTTCTSQADCAANAPVGWLN